MARALSAAREQAKLEAWDHVLELTEAHRSVTPVDGELALLVGEALMRTGRERAALRWLESAESGLEARDRQAHRHLLNLLGAAHFGLGELDEAAGNFIEAREAALRETDLLLMARATNNLGAIANLRGEPETALANYRLALPAYQRVGQHRGIAEAYHNIAITCRDLGHLDDADEHERRAIEHATDAAAPRLAAMGRIGRAEIALRRGDAELAETTARLAREEFERLGDPQNEADAFRLIGAACSAQRRYSAALEAFAHALNIARAHDHALNEAETLRDRVEVWLGRSEVVPALDDASHAIAIFDRLGAVRERDALRERVEGLK
jgi:tetratricopeptide (TPR) repeat protein